MNRDPAIAALPVIEVLESLGIAYYVGGSLASSYLGVGRSTVDVDIIAAFSKKDVPAFVASLESTYYLDADIIRDAIDRSSSFNVIHFEP